MITVLVYLTLIVNAFGLVLSLRQHVTIAAAITAFIIGAVVGGLFVWGLEPRRGFAMMQMKARKRRDGYVVETDEGLIAIPDRDVAPDGTVMVGWPTGRNGTKRLVVINGAHVWVEETELTVRQPPQAQPIGAAP